MNNEHTRLFPHTYNDMLGHTCRDCLNKSFNAHLTSIDVVYDGKNPIKYPAVPEE